MIPLVSQDEENNITFDEKYNIKEIPQVLCCGSYPDRFPYKTKGGERHCCGAKTFNSQFFTCCDQESSEIGLIC